MSNGEVKVCKRCRVEHPVEKFYVRKKKSGARDTTCGDCRAAMQRERMQDHGPDEFSLAFRAWGGPVTMGLITWIIA